MFKQNNLTDFEKLLFAEKRIDELHGQLKQLEKEKGVLHSELEELKYNFKQENPSKYKDQVKALRKKFNLYSKKYKYVNQQFIEVTEMLDKLT